jgi:uncharacterized membrane protein YGL010W
MSNYIKKMSNNNYINKVKDCIYLLTKIVCNQKLVSNEILILLFGYKFHYLQNMIGMRNLADGVEYYAEVHRTFWNSIIHTICMPITMFGMYVWIPALFRLNKEEAFTLKCYAMIFYFGLYSQISLHVTIMIMCLYFYSFAFSTKMYNYFYDDDKSLNLICGLLISFAALSIQEYVGHYFGGDAPSRIEAIPNAILYACYYSVSHLYE